MNTTTKVVLEKDRHSGELQSIASFASELLDDMQKIYSNRIESSISKIMQFECLKEDSVGEAPKEGDFVVIASRSSELRTQLSIGLIRWFGLERMKPVVIYSAADSAIQLTRKLMGFKAGIAADTAIYDGKMDDAEMTRALMALRMLIHAKIYKFPKPQIGRVAIDQAIDEFNQQHGEIGLLLVDAPLGSIRFCGIKTQSKFSDMKTLAEVKRVPVVAYHWLDSHVDCPPSTLTRIELREAEKITELADGFVLMTKEQEFVTAVLPKIPKAKQVVWLDQAKGRMSID